MGIGRVRQLALTILAAGVASCAATVAEPSTAVTAMGAAAESEMPFSSGSASDDGETVNANGGHDTALSSSLEATAKSTLSEYLSRPVAEIELVSIVPIDWRDSSLGCPQPDRGYMQVITPGHYAVLRHGGRGYRVHMADGSAFVCDRVAGDAKTKKLPVPMLALPVDQLQALAKADLARRLGAQVEQISLVRTQSVMWPDASLGCRVAGQSYQPTKSKGYVFEFSCSGRTYNYHADFHRVLPCPPLESR